MTIPDRTGLVVPVVLWGHKSPRNRMCQVSCLSNGRVIVTGTLDGQVIQWVVDEALGWIQPQMMLLVHDCAITCISPTSSSATSTKYVTCSQDGHMCLWDSVDGRVVESVRGNYVHRQIFSHTLKCTSTSPQQSLLFCIGDYAEIVVMDARDLNVLFILSSKIEPDWINTMTIVQPQNKFDVVIGVSVSGIIKLWSLNDLDKKNTSQVIYEDESKVMTSKNVNHIHCSNLNTRMMLVICNNSWQIVDPSNLNQLIVSECVIEAVKGTIIDVDRVAIGFADSTIVLFQLPRSKLCGKQVRDKFGENPQNVGGIDQPFVFALVKGITASPVTPLSSTVQFHFDSRINAEGKRRRVAYGVDQLGTLSVWHIPKNFDLLVNEFVRSRRPVVYEPTMKQTFGEVWNRLNPPPPTICGPDEEQTITATIHVGSQGKLFLGYEDGSIVMMNACQAIMNQLLETSSRSDDTQHRMLYGHSAAVNCFLYPYEESTRYDPQMLLSGGADFAVVVWNIYTGQKSHRFCCQGGPILRMLVPPSNCNPRVLHTICAIAGDNSASLLSLKENKCILLASRQQFPIIDVRWRPIDDFMLLRCEDDSVYVWEMETSNLDRIVTGLVTEDVMEACKEQIGLADVEDEAGASQAVQMLRALKNKNVAAIKKIAAHTGDKSSGMDFSHTGTMSPPMDIVQLKKCSDQTQLILFNVDKLIAGLLTMDYELAALASPHAPGGVDLGENKMSLSTLISKKAEQHIHQNHLPHVPHQHNLPTTASNGSASHNHSTTGPPSPVKSAQSLRWQAESGLYVDAARLLISLLHAWNLDENLDSICLKTLKLLQPKVPICYGTISRKGHVSLYMPYCTGKLPALNDLSYRNFSLNIRWQENRTITTAHLLSVIAVSNTLMSFRSRSTHFLGGVKRPTLRRAPSVKSSEHLAESDGHQIKQGWSNVAALHCVLLPDLVKPPGSYAAPRIDLLARRWQDNSVEIRDAGQALLIRELDRLGPEGRKKLIEYWVLFLPTLLDPSLSIFGLKLSGTPTALPQQQTPYSTTANTPSGAPPNNLSHHFTSNVGLPNSSESSTLSAIPHNPTTVGAKSAPPPRPIPPVPPRQRGTSASNLPSPAVAFTPPLAAPYPVPASAVANPSGDLSAIDSSSKSSVSSIVSTGAQTMANSGAGTNHFNNNNIPGNYYVDSTAAATSSSSMSAESQKVSVPTSLEIRGLTTTVGLDDGDDDKCGGIHQVRRNQATAIIVLSVIGAEFPADLQTNVDLVRATAHSLLELLTTPESPLLPLNSPLRRAATDLLGRGFGVWQPHLDISKVLLTLLELAAAGEKSMPLGGFEQHFGAPLSAAADACRTARHSLSLIASARPQALITALSMEVARYNSTTQHQTIQHALVSPLLKCRGEVLWLVEQLADKQYNCVADLILPVGDILVHCLDTSLLKQRTLAEVFPPIAKFYMVAYCPATRRIAFGGKNGSINVHELRASKAQTVAAHSAPITALAFSQDGKYLAAYASQDAKISFWQTQQSFLGMGQSQIRCVKTLPAPSEFPVVTPGGNYQLFRARLVWINTKSLTLMLPNGKENRFTV